MSPLPELFLTFKFIFNLATVGILAVVSGFSTFSIPSDQIVPVSQQDTETSVQEEAPLTTQEMVSRYFADIPIMVDIARCESTFRQYDKNGNVLRGKANRYDVGVMQINEYFHLEKSEKLGYDIYSIEGNMAYARYLYEKEGARPWLASSNCWAKYTELAKR